MMTAPPVLPMNAPADPWFASPRLTPPMNGRVVGGGVAALLLGAGYLGATVGWRQAALFVVGAVAGLVLYHAAFGFTSAWRVFIVDRRGAGVRAQMTMLALACLAFVPLLASGRVLGHVVRGAVAPLGVDLLLGAFLFGVGMQLAGGCASGTLYSVGGGSTRTVVTLAAFVVGALTQTAHAPFWATLPSVAPVSLLALLGPAAALAISLGAMATIAVVSARLERRRHGELTSIRATATGRLGALRGPWPLVWGAIGLAAINVATLVLAGRPWGVTSAFALWGAKIAQGLGVDVAAWPWWRVASRSASLAAPVAADITSVMNAGIMLGAFVAAGLAGRFGLVWRVPARSLLAAVLGGLLLGYGARLAYGCNIGAFFSGVASTSLHGWVWLVAAFAGNWIGTRLRPLFGLGS